jgi:hypothetical protein
MKTVAGLIAIATLFAGCVVTTPTQVTTATPAATPTTFSGEVWTWDEREDTVTLFKDGRSFRVHVTPDQMRTLQLHQNVTLRGELAPPANLPQLVTPLQPMTPVARGTAEQIELAGSVTSSDPNGRVSIDSPRGPVHLWVASGADQRFRPGSAVRATVNIQPVTMVPSGAGGPSASASPDMAAPAAGTGPGDYSAVVGRIIGVNPTGSLVIESPTGPIQIWVPSPDHYHLSDFVQVRTALRSTP